MGVQSLGHFQVGSYCYRSLTEGLYTFLSLIEALYTRNSPPLVSLNVQRCYGCKVQGLRELLGCQVRLALGLFIFGQN